MLQAEYNLKKIGKPYRLLLKIILYLIEFHNFPEYQQLTMNTLPETLNNLRQDLIKNQTKESAWNIIDKYFNFLGLDDIHNELWVLTVGTLTNDEMQQFEKGIERHNLIFFFEYTKMFFEAVDLLYNKRKKKS
jgi:hypothetical protein